MKPESKTPRVLFPVVHTARISHARAADISALQDELSQVYLDSLSNLGKGFVARDVHPYAVRPDNAGRDLIIRVMVHIEADCTRPASGGPA